MSKDDWHGMDSNNNLPQGQWALSTIQVVGDKGWKNPADIASLLWNTVLMSVCMVMSHSAHRNGRGSQPWHRTSAALMPHCWHMCVPTCSFAAVVLISCGLSARHLSKREWFRVLQSDEARRGAFGVGASSRSADAMLRECWSSFKKHSAKIVWDSK